jgi:hypothetical protein
VVALSFFIPQKRKSPELVGAFSYVDLLFFLRRICPKLLHRQQPELSPGVAAHPA